MNPNGHINVVITVYLFIKQNETGRFVDVRFHDGSSVRQLIAADPVLRTLLRPIPIDLQMAEMMRNERKLELGPKLDTFVELQPFHSSRPTLVPLNSVDFSVRISDFNKPCGPLSFYVHLTANDDEYQRFQFDLQKHKKNINATTSLGFIPPLGTKCLALIKDQLHRAVTIKSTDKQNKSHVSILLLEKGSELSVDIKCLHRMPHDIPDVPPFAKQFKLADFLQDSIRHLNQSEVDFYFQHITKQKLLTINCVSPTVEKLPATLEAFVQNVTAPIPLCNLFDGNINILEKVKNWNPHKLRYLEQPKLTQGVYKVKVSSVESPKTFHVQLQNSAEQTKFQNLTDSLKIFDAPKLRQPQVNDACIVQVDINNLRGRIVKKTTSEIFKVQFIDDGFTGNFS